MVIIKFKDYVQHFEIKLLFLLTYILNNYSDLPHRSYYEIFCYGNRVYSLILIYPITY